MALPDELECGFFCKFISHFLRNYPIYPHVSIILSIKAHFDNSLKIKVFLLKG